MEGPAYFSGVFMVAYEATTNSSTSAVLTRPLQLRHVVGPLHSGSFARALHRAVPRHGKKPTWPSQWHLPLGAQPQPRPPSSPRA